MTDIQVLKGHIIYTKEKDSFEVHKNSYIIIKDHTVIGICETLPEEYRCIPVMDYGDALIIPSFIDLHIHAPQYMQMGVGLNLGLIDWLNQYTFKNEAKFEDLAYAEKVYPRFVDALYQNGTLRSCIFATIHKESTHELVKALENKHLAAYVGKVNMNQNAPDNLLETTDMSVSETIDFIEAIGEARYVKPIITPRFAPSCTSELMQELGKLSNDRAIPIQTHLAETKREINWVMELFPDSKTYSHVYEDHQLYGQQKSLMAHAVYLSDEELEMAKNQEVFLVHCPNSNLNLTSGIMPVTTCIDQGIQVGMGSDVGAGHKIGMNHTITCAIQCSKMRHVINPEERILKESEAFYLATKLNGRFFGNVGSFEEGYLFDALIIKDPDHLMDELTPLEQLQRFLYCGGPDSIIGRYLEGCSI